MLSIADIIAYEESLKVERKRVDQALEACAALKAHLLAQASGKQQPLPLIDKATEQPTFSQAVREAVQTFPGQEFLVVNVEQVLKARDVPLPKKNVRARIAMVLQELVKKGVVVVAHKGGGNAPYRFRLVSDAANGDAEKGTENNAPTLFSAGSANKVHGRTAH